MFSMMNKTPASMNNKFEVSKYEKCSKTYFPLLNFMIEMIKVVKSMAKSIAKKVQ